jgi:di/tricarboxylate transporter
MYQAVNWDIVILIGGMSAFSRGIETSGFGKLIADSILNVTGPQVSPIVILLILFIVTVFITQFMSDNGAVALMAPIAIMLAKAQGLASPHGYVMACLIGCMGAHFSIMASPSLAFIQGLGGYSNKYFVKQAACIELPVNLLIAMIMIPLVYL